MCLLVNGLKEKVAKGCEFWHAMFASCKLWLRQLKPILGEQHRGSGEKSENGYWSPKKFAFAQLFFFYLNLIPCTNFDDKNLNGAQSLWSTMRLWKYAWNSLGS